jgi:hypothetical protein
MRTEDDLRAAFTELERHAPDAARVLPSAGRGRRARISRPAWRLAIAVPVALALAAGVLVAVLPSRAPVLTAQLLADRAAAAALASPAVSPGAWVYQETEFSRPGPHRAGVPDHFVQNGWMTADGNINYGAGSIGNPIFPYSKLGSLPRNPAKLNAYFRSLDPVKTDNTSSVEFSQIEQMLFGMVLPPSLKAEMFHALALIPLIQVKDHVKDIAGRAGVAFVLPPTRNNLKLEIILDASSYQLLAQGSWGNPSLPAPDSETAILKEYLVAELGSTQPSTAPPSATELAAERIDYNQEHLTSPPKISSVTPGQWLYRDLRVNGENSPIWATADDSAQAQYVNGTLRVCQRTDPCASSEQWLMPAGPSYSLIHPPHPTRAQVKKYVQALKHHAKAASPFQQVKPTLPQYPQPLLAKLNTYKTGCGDAAADCNAVNVAANVLTGYGNYPSLNATWFYALADVPGVSVQHITNAAGQKDIAFTFPARDGVTAILINARQLNAGAIQYDGYVRDGQQTLVLDQALVRGPGVRP